jgi:uncharacterized protein (DUF697 family)
VATLGPRTVLALIREVRGHDPRPVFVGGARELVPLLAAGLRAGGDPAAVDEHGPLEAAAAVVWLGAADEDALRRAWRAGVPIVGVSDGRSLPYVVDTRLVRIPPGSGLPVEEIAATLARTLGREGLHLAARLPVLRGPLLEWLIETAARRNAVIAAAVFVPGADLPVLTLTQLRLVLEVALASGYEIGLTRVPELLGVVGAGFGSRQFARMLVSSVPVGGFALQAGVAYTATRAIGEAARARFAGATVSVRPGS